MAIHTRLYDRIVTLHPQITVEDFISQKIVLRDDGEGAYIEKWEYAGIEQPTDEQLSAITLPEDALAISGTEAV